MPGAAIIDGVRLSHPDRILFPDAKATKRDLALYYKAIAPRMMPYIEGRLVSIVRAPTGVEGERFFQRHVGASLPKAFKRVTVRKEGGATLDYMMLVDASALITAAQFGVLEIHIWGSRADKPDRPDRIVLDLDPDPGLPFSTVKDAAFNAREALLEFGLESFAMLTGGKGVHVVVPIVRRHGWETIEGFASGVASLMVEAQPSRFVATMSKAKRQGKIFIDHFRNVFSASAIAPYSSRARSTGSIACPVEWEELNQAARADASTILDIACLLAKPAPWPGYGSLKQGLNASALGLARSRGRA